MWGSGVKMKYQCDICNRWFRDRFGIANHKKWHNPDYARRCNQFKFGYKHSKETKKKMSLAKLGRKNPLYGKRWGLSLRPITPEEREHRKERARKEWSDPEYVKKQMKARGVRPNKVERKVEELVEQHKLPYRYVGDGKIIIGGKCPDFVSIDGNTVVEVFGIFWHLRKPRYLLGSWTKQDEEAKYRNHYRKHGYTFVSLWEDESEAWLPKLMDGILWHDLSDNTAPGDMLTTPEGGF